MNVNYTNTKVITVATHNEGNLIDLLNNPYGIDIIVLGYGRKWTGFKMKFELIYDYVKDLPDDTLIIFIDGFDSEIKKPLEDAVHTFKTKQYKLLFSKDLPKTNCITKMLSSRFKVCKYNKVANTGLYMGYVKYIKIFLKKCLAYKCKDDQIILNSICSELDFLDMDMEEEIFQNTTNQYNNKAVFISHPGNVLNFNRLKRSIFEYRNGFILFTLFLYLSFSSVILFYSKNKDIKVIGFGFILLLFIYVIVNMDYSCKCLI